MTNVPKKSNGKPYGSYYIKQLQDKTVERTDSNGRNYVTTWKGEDQDDAGGGNLNNKTPKNDDTWKDAPHTDMIPTDTRLSRHESFKDYLMFNPGGDSIDVPMYFATWGWGGTEQPFGTLVSSSTSGPTGPSLTTDFPEWNNISTP